MKLLVCDALSDNAVNGLKNIKGLEVTVKTGLNPEELKEVIKDQNIAIVRSATKIRKDIIDAAPELKLVIRGGVGVDNIDVEYAKSKNISVRNTPGASSNSVAELALGMMFAISRDLYTSTNSMKNSKWEKKKFNGFELAGKTLGIIGCGKIGQSLAKKAIALGMNAIGFIRSPKPAIEGLEYTTSLDELLKKSDFISIHTPFVKEVGPLLKKEQFCKMKEGVCIVNCSRGGVVCEKDLLEALNKGQVQACGIDVFEKEPTGNTELLEHERVIVASPHIGAQTREGQDRVGDEIVEIVQEFMNA
ncbi:MAG: D-2-hydroxyacid dehydrogenase [Candidatus Muirbacterium halophilum]|nr:D-2-hydroxyacid dehydrogenase [Candidatus Muirbacterium halophilum]MCK9475414.1 D-2-hydroxyacid dehydrogenase [Candidatus Muirbacterium halophilum]